MSMLQRSSASVLESFSLDLFVGVLCLVNLFFIGWETDARASGSEVPPWLIHVRYSFVVVFVAELTGRMFVFRVRFFQSKTNLVDFFVVISDVCIELMDLYDLGGAMLPPPSIFRVVRLWRLVRVTRALAAFQELDFMVRCAASAVRAMLAAVVLLALMLTVFAIIAVEVLHPLNRSLDEAGVYDGMQCQRCPRAFASVAQSLLTCAQQLFAGNEWSTIMVPIMERFPWTSPFIFLAFLSVNLVIMNMVMAAMVDRAQQARMDANNEALSCTAMRWDNARRKLKRLAPQLDVKGDGTISLDDFISGCQADPALWAALSALDVRKDDIEILFHGLDSDHSGRVDYAEFIDWLHKSKTVASHTMLVIMKSHLEELINTVNEEALLRQGRAGVLQKGFDYGTYPHAAWEGQASAAGYEFCSPVVHRLTAAADSLTEVSDCGRVPAEFSMTPSVASSWVSREGLLAVPMELATQSVASSRGSQGGSLAVPMELVRSRSPSVAAWSISATEDCEMAIVPGEKSVGEGSDAASEDRSFTPLFARDNRVPSEIPSEVSLHAMHGEHMLPGSAVPDNHAGRYAPSVVSSVDYQSSSVPRERPSTAPSVIPSEDAPISFSDNDQHSAIPLENENELHGLPQDFDHDPGRDDVRVMAPQAAGSSFRQFAAPPSITASEECSAASVPEEHASDTWHHDTTPQQRIMSSPPSVSPSEDCRLAEVGVEHSEPGFETSRAPSDADGAFQLHVDEILYQGHSSGSGLPSHVREHASAAPLSREPSVSYCSSVVAASVAQEGARAPPTPNLSGTSTPVLMPVAFPQWSGPQRFVPCGDSISVGESAVSAEQATGPQGWGPHRFEPNGDYASTGTRIVSAEHQPNSRWLGPQRFVPYLGSDASSVSAASVAHEASASHAPQSQNLSGMSTPVIDGDASEDCRAASVAQEADEKLSSAGSQHSSSWWGLQRFAAPFFGSRAFTASEGTVAQENSVRSKASSTAQGREVHEHFSASEGSVAEEISVRSKASSLAQGREVHEHEGRSVASSMGSIAQEADGQSQRSQQSQESAQYYQLQQHHMELQLQELQLQQQWLHQQQQQQQQIQLPAQGQEILQHLDQQRLVQYRGSDASSVSAASVAQEIEGHMSLQRSVSGTSTLMFYDGASENSRPASVAQERPLSDGQRSSSWFGLQRFTAPFFRSSSRNGSQANLSREGSFSATGSVADEAGWARPPRNLRGSPERLEQVTFEGQGSASAASLAGSEVSAGGSHVPHEFLRHRISRGEGGSAQELFAEAQALAHHSAAQLQGSTLLAGRSSQGSEIGSLPSVAQELITSPDAAGPVGLHVALIPQTQSFDETASEDCRRHDIEGIPLEIGYSRPSWPPSATGAPSAWPPAEIFESGPPSAQLSRLEHMLACLEGMLASHALCVEHDLARIEGGLAAQAQNTELGFDSVARSLAALAEVGLAVRQPPWPALQNGQQNQPPSETGSITPLVADEGGRDLSPAAPQRFVSVVASALAALASPAETGLFPGASPSEGAEAPPSPRRASPQRSPGQATPNRGTPPTSRPAQLDNAGGRELGPIQMEDLTMRLNGLPANHRTLRGRRRPDYVSSGGTLTPVSEVDTGEQWSDPGTDPIAGAAVARAADGSSGGSAGFARTSTGSAANALNSQVVASRRRHGTPSRSQGRGQAIRRPSADGRPFRASSSGSVGGGNRLNHSHRGTPAVVAPGSRQDGQTLDDFRRLMRLEREESLRVLQMARAERERASRGTRSIQFVGGGRPHQGFQSAGPAIAPRGRGTPSRSRSPERERVLETGSI